MKKLYALIVFVALSSSVFAQQDPLFTQYMFNYSYYNPAVSGTEGVTKINAAYRNQWTGYVPTGTSVTGLNPQTQFVGISAPILTKRMGLGFHVVNDQLGTSTRLDFLLSASYQIAIGNNKLSLGLRSGFYSRGLDLTNLIFANPNDPVANDEANTDVRPEIGFGVYFRAPTFYAGVAFNHLATPNPIFSIGETQLDPLSTHGYAFAGYEFEILNSWIITPSVLLKTDLNTYSVDVGVLANNDDKLYAGVTWRQAEAVNLMVGYNILGDTKRKNKDWLRLSYSFDLVVTETQAKELTSHEIMLSYILPTPENKGRVAPRTPRFSN